MIRTLNKLVTTLLVVGLCGVIGSIALSLIGYYLASDVNWRLSFLESTIVGACPDDIEIPEGARCRQGFHRQQARAVIAELCRVNNLECVNITDEWPQ